MRDIDSTKTEQEQAEHEISKTETSLAIPASSSNIRKRLLIILSLLSLYFLWGGTYLAMRIALQGFPPFILAGVRQLTAGILLFLFLWLRKHELPTRKQWLTAIVVGGLLLVVGNGGVVFAEQWVSSGLAALALGAIPLWTALFSGLFGRWPTRIEWFGLGLGFSGLVLLNLENGIHANPLGAIVLFIAPIGWAFGSILSQHLPSPKGLMASTSQMLAGGVLLFVVGFATGEHMTSMPGPGPLAAMAYLIIGGSLVAFSAYGYLLRNVRPALATSYAYVNPLVAVGLGVALAGEQITMIGILAMLTILSGVGLVSLGKERR
ncbi:MAG TPA: drug/metabolite exporter YedA [Ktedonobacteraceae bacterium]|jgi:drug/metabolite transporter (DMT)-like permease|nr:drug/metabolite exporter YedA [Ktedonobacteraceae bacterium]